VNRAVSALLVITPTMQVEGILYLWSPYRDHLQFWLTLLYR